MAFWCKESRQLAREGKQSSIELILTEFKVVSQPMEVICARFAGKDPFAMKDSSNSKYVKLMLGGRMKSRSMTSPRSSGLSDILRSSYVADVTMPKLWPAPRMAQKRSGFEVLET